jgi:hypothetical protein
MILRLPWLSTDNVQGASRFNPSLKAPKSVDIDQESVIIEECQEKEGLILSA